MDGMESRNDEEDYLMRDSLSPSNFEQVRKTYHQRAGT